MKIKYCLKCKSLPVLDKSINSVRYYCPKCVLRHTHWIYRDIDRNYFTKDATEIAADVWNDLNSF